MLRGELIDADEWDRMQLASESSAAPRTPALAEDPCELVRRLEEIGLTEEHLMFMVAEALVVSSAEARAVIEHKPAA